MATDTTGSLNVASLDSKIVADLCAGIFYIDLTPTVWIGSGFSNVLGASVKIVNPYGVIIRNYPTSGYDIYPPMTGITQVSVPTQANNYQYGTYQVTVQLTDSDGTLWTITKPTTICAPNPLNKNLKYGSLSAILDGNCVSGKVSVIADTVPTYQGKISESQVNAFVLEYPTGSGLDELDTSVGSFSAQLFEGVYKFTGTICALYNLGDNVFVKVNYRVKREKNIRCLLDKSCVATRMAALQQQIATDCTDAEKISTQNTIVQALLLISVIDGLTNSGQDASDFIGQLEEVLGCVCTCNCADGTPIINNNPTGDFVVEGCNVSSEVVDLTTVYTIENYIYTVEIARNGGAITITTPTLNECIQTQTITFNIAVVYSQVKNQIINSTEYNFWASIVNHAIDANNIDCLDITQTQWDAYSFTQRIQAIITASCTGGECDAEISLGTVTATANNVTITWNNIVDVFEVAVYLDDVFVASVLDPTETYEIQGAADGNVHTYSLIPKCTNGGIGERLTGTFTYFGCPTYAPPTLSSNNVSGASCPYDLTTLLSSLPSPLFPEWHNQNNHDAASLVADPSAATQGIYYVYARDAAGCYSQLNASVVLTCSAATNCSAPQNMIVEAITSGFRVRFQSAAYPPPLSSYTVKRRLTSDPDVSGSYTTLGNATYNSSAARWEILDTTAINNTSYTYRAISNCTSTAPYIDYVFANIDCPTLTLTPSSSSMGYSFVGSGGDIDKYEVKLYNFAGVVLIHTDTILPVFSNPITGTFLYLSQGTTYKVRIRAYIGTFYQDCSLISGTTTGSSGSINLSNCGNGNAISAITFNGTPITVSGGYPIAEGASRNAVIDNVAENGTLAITITGHTGGTVTRLQIVSSSNEPDCLPITANGLYTFTNVDIRNGLPFGVYLVCGGVCP